MIGNTPNGAPFVPVDGIGISKLVNITGTGALAAQLLQLEGSVRIIDQYALIEAITTKTNATNVYATLWDGTVSVDLTLDGVDISAAPVGSLFTKDNVAASTYSVNSADQGRLNDLEWGGTGRPFTVTQKNGVDTFLRFHLTTTDNPIDFDMRVFFRYIPLGPTSRLYFL